MHAFRDCSINRKLGFIIVVSTGVALLLACAAFLTYDLMTFRQHTADALLGDAQIMAVNCAAAVMFNDSGSAEETLAALRVHGEIVAARVYTRHGDVFATYLRDGTSQALIQSDLRPAGHYFEAGHLLLFQPIVFDQEIVGTVYIDSELLGLYRRAHRYAGIALAVMAVSLLGAFLLSLGLRRIVSEPILRLAETAKDVTERKDYSVRAVKRGDDELGLLANSFNEMLEQIERHEAAQQESHAVLEQRVAERTKGLRREIRDRERAEKALGESEQRYRTLFRTMIDAFALHETICNGQGDPVDYRFLQVNPAFEKMTGFLAEQVIGKTVREVLPDIESYWIETYGKVALTGESIRFENYSGQLNKHFEVVAYSPQKGQFATVFVDVTDRKRAEEAQARMATATEQTAEAIFITATDGTIQYVNPAFERITGYSREEVLGQNPRILNSGKQKKEFYCRMWDTLKKGEVWTGHFVNRRKDGTFYEEDATISPVRDQSGAIVNYVAVKRDVTDHIILEAQLRQAQKMEAIGLLAGGVAHDFNNLLTGILGYANILKEEAEPEGEIHKAADMIEMAAERAALLTGQLLGFARKGKMQNISVDMDDTIHEVIRLLDRTIDKSIVITQHSCTRNATVLGDPGQLQQVILNLAINARDAMPKGGKLTFEIAEVDLDEAYCRVHPSAAPGRHLFLSVTDTGSGIPKEALEHIFEPFYTTKDMGKGTGMGLAMVYGIVKNHGGFVLVNSEVGRGTTFKVYLPRLVYHSSQKSEEPRLDAVRGTGHILVVDDEEVVRNVASSMLRALGYEVSTVSNGRDAIEFFDTSVDEVDAVIIDMIMPEMGGGECFDAIKEIKPNVKTILSTGYGLNGAAQEIIDRGVTGFVQKPYMMNQLSEIVAQVLSQ